MHVTDTLEMMERAYDDWKDGRWSRAPYIDMLIPSQIDPTMAPEGQHYMSVFVQYCPYRLADGEWTPAKRQAFGNTVIDTIARQSPNFKDLILHAEIRTPWDIENEVGLTEGNIFQGELTMDQLLFNRPVPGYAQYRAPVKGLYMCGSSTHPGGGVMGAPGANAARAVLRDLGKLH
jgi:phytoene dehydrogenase-like protein